jgi:hypothetical protein
VFLCVVYVLFISLSNSRVVEGKNMNGFTGNQYQNLFLSHAGGHEEEVLECVQCWVTAEMNEILLASFTVEEVCCVVDSIGDLNAPRGGWFPSDHLHAVLATNGEKNKGGSSFCSLLQNCDPTLCKKSHHCPTLLTPMILCFLGTIT